MKRDEIRTFQFTKLSLKLLAVFMGVLFLVMLGFSVYLVQMHDSLMTTANERLDRLVTSHRRSLALALWNLEPESAEQALLDLQGDPWLLGAQALDTEGHVVASIGRTVATPDGRFQRQATLRYSDPYVDKEVGLFRIALDPEQVFDDISDAIQGEVLIIGSSFLLTLILLPLATRRFVGRPIHLLTRSMQHYQDTRRAEPVDWDSDDELGEIVRTYNELLHEEREARTALYQHQQELEDRVKERTAEYRKAKREADAANRAKSDFLATMSHEIRTPLNGVVGTLEVLAHSRLDRDQRQLLRTVRDSGDALLQVVNDILDFSKIESGKLQLEPTPVDLSSLMESIAFVMASRCHEKGLQFGLFLDPHLAREYLLDGVRLRQVVSNLLSNAIKFTEQGFVNLEVQVGEVNGKQAEISIEVADSGIGIPAEAQKSLFQPFTQAEASTTRRYGGTGLGLSICRRLANLMGGEIQLTSAPGEGTSMRFSFSAEVRQERMPAGSLAGHNALVVCEDPFLSRVLNCYLTQWAVEVRTPPEVPQHEPDVQALITEASEDLIILFHRKLLDPDARERLVSQLARLAGRKPALLLTLAPDLSGNLFDQHLIQLSGNPLQPSALERAVHTALGVPVADGPAQLPSESGSRELPDRETAIDRGELILVAEDHPINRDVISKQLALLGYQCDIVENGQAALQAWQSGDYGLMFTDCHMPEMDGYELAGRIRAAEPAGEHMPIIALTASALVGEAEKCRSAGMDDYLSKPVTMSRLREKLVAHLPAAQSAVRDVQTTEDETTTHCATDSSGQDSPSGAVLDTSLLESVFGDLQSARKMLDDYLVASAADLATLQHAVEQGLVVEARETAHRMKGAAGILGAQRLIDACMRLEAAGNSGQAQELQPLYLALVDAYQELKEAIQALAEQR